MATTYQIKQLATPTVIVNGVVIPIVPNSGMVRIPGDYKVRAMSTGGGSTVPVVGLNAESLVGHVKFELAATAENMDRVRAWKQLALTQVGVTINFITPDGQYPHQLMFLTKETDARFSADGNIPCDWEGQMVQ